VAAPVASVEADVVLEPGSGSRGGVNEASGPTGTIDLYSGPDQGSTGGGAGGRYGTRDQADRRAQWLRVKVTDTQTGTTTLDTRFPAGAGQWLGWAGQTVMFMFLSLLCPLAALPSALACPPICPSLPSC
jgi:hypothetical protein